MHVASANVNAAVQALRRICLPKPGSGHRDVPKEVEAKFRMRGAARDALVDMYINECGMDKARWELILPYTKLF